MTEAELFDRACKALWGELYVAPAALALDMEKNTVSKLRNGKSRISPRIWERIAYLLSERVETIVAVQLALANRGLGSLAGLGDEASTVKAAGIHHAAEPFTPEPAKKKPRTSGE